MVIIIGGGIAGLAAAYELTVRQIPFVLLEASERLGGLIFTEQHGGFTLDAGPDSLLVQKPAAVELCDELGVPLMATTPPRQAFVLKQERLYPLPSPSVLGLPTSLSAVFRYDLLDWPARLRLALEPLVPRRPAADESVASFFRRRFGQRAVDLIAEPLLGGIHAGDVERLSMPSVFPRLLIPERNGRSVLHDIAHTSGAPSHGLFRAPRGGMRELVTALAARLPRGAVALNAPATDLAAGQSSWRVRGGAGMIDGAAVILAAPAHAAARLLAPIDVAASQLCAAVPYTSTASVALGWRRDEIPHPLAGSGFVVARRHSAVRITACTWVSSKWEGRAPAGHALLRAFLGGAHDPSVVDLGDDELIQTAVADVSRVLGIARPPMLARVYRWRNSGAQHHVGHRARMEGLAARLRNLPGLFVTGSGFESIGIPDCVAHGRRAAAAAADCVTMGQGRASGTP